MSCGLLYAAERITTIRPNAILWKSLHALNNNDGVRSQAGGALTLGPLQAFRQHGGKWVIENHKLVWKKPQVQLVYNAIGPAQEIYVTVDASRTGWNEEITFIGAYVRGPTEPSISRSRIVVVGNDEGFALSDKLNPLVTFHGWKK